MLQWFAAAVILSLSERVLPAVLFQELVILTCAWLSARGSFMFFGLRILDNLRSFLASWDFMAFIFALRVAWHTGRPQVTCALLATLPPQVSHVCVLRASASSRTALPSYVILIRLSIGSL